MSESTMEISDQEGRASLRRRIHRKSCCMEAMTMAVSCTILAVDLVTTGLRQSLQL